MTAKSRKRKSLKTKDKKSVLPGKSETKKKAKTGGKQGVKNSKATQFKKGVSGNPKGRPPKLLRTMMEQLKEKGYERITPGQIKDAFETVMNLDRKKITQLATSQDVPIILNVVAISLLDKNSRAKMLEMVLDRVHGKPKQQLGVVLDDNKAPDLSDKSFEELYQLKYGKKPD